MTKIILQKRELIGKNVSKKLGATDIIPAVVYNSQKESTNVQIPRGEAERLLRTATKTTIVDIDFEGKEFKATVKEVDYDPIKGEIRHVAFFEVDEKKPMTFEIPVNLTGISPAVKNNLGVLVQPTQSLLVRCTLKSLVPSIDVDISGLEHPGQTIVISDIKLPEGIEMLHKDEMDKALASISQLQKLVEEELKESSTEEGAATEQGAESEAASATEEKA